MLFRQAGKSTIMAAYLLWYATFNERKTAVMLANKMKIAQEIFSKIREAHTHLPAFLQQGVVEWNKSSLKYENGSRIVTAATSPTAVRGMSANLLMLDEFAFLEDNLADEFIASVFPTLSSSKESKLVIVSTPNGVNNAFHKIWVGAEQGTNGFVNVKGHWSEARDQDWADEQLKALGEVKFNAEVLCQFAGSSHTLVNGSKLASIPTVKPKASSDSINIFEYPDKNRKYVGCIDTSRGRGRDHSAMIVYDVTEMPYRIVCTFKDNKISALEYPTIISLIGKQYNNATLLIENNDLGESVANSLWYDHEYEDIIWTHNEKIAGHGTIGVRTSRKVKQKGCNNIKELIEHDQLIVNDERVIEELNVYTLSKKGLYAARNTKINDDLCTCLFLFGWLIEQSYFEDLTSINTSGEMTRKVSSLVDDYIPSGFRSDGTEHYEYPQFKQLDTDQLELLNM